MDLQQIITLHLDGLSNRKVADYLGISRHTVNDYIQRVLIPVIVPLRN
ncbi:MAG: helix-turn-helix domain-containing protein [Bacteroidota bacterium]